MRTFGIVLFVAVVLGCVLFIPMKTVAADGGTWGAPSTPTPDPNNHGYLVQAEHRDQYGEVDQTVTTGVAKTKRQARKASKALAQSMTASGNGFKWDPACAGLLCK